MHTHLTEVLSRLDTARGALRGAIDAIPLHAVAPKQFDWDLFARMHGSDS